VSELILLVRGAAGGGYVARALGHPIFTEADSWEELVEAVRDAVRCHFEDAVQPEMVGLHGVREEAVAL